MSDPSAGSAKDSGASKQKNSRPSRTPMIVAAGVGAVLTGLAAATVLGIGQNPPHAGAAVISEVSAVSLGAASQTLDSSASAGLIAQAKACRAPLAFVTLTGTAGQAGRTVRIRSGGYVSPPFVVSPTGQRIAIPFPTPYATGKGQIFVEGNTTGVALALFPTIHPAQANGGVINIWWHTDKPCGG